MQVEIVLTEDQKKQFEFLLSDKGKIKLEPESVQLDFKNNKFYLNLAPIDINLNKIDGNEISS